MPTLVQKFGGSSLADLDRLERVAEKIVATRRRGYDLVVVVSAMGDTTDELLAMAHRVTASPSRRELDMLLSVGERIAMALLSMAIQRHGLEAISLTGSQCGILTTASHSDARIIDVRPFRVQDELAQGRVVIVAGYQGTSYKREVTTLGRGGSDTTAVALAAALGAEACELYSDVDGIFSADPRVVLDAERLIALSHAEMLEMARSGARVLNEHAVAFAKRSSIALYARSAHAPESLGTVVRPDGFDELIARAESDRPRALAVSHLEHGLTLTCREPSFVSALLSRLAPYALTIVQPLEGGGLSVFMDVSNVHDLDDLIAFFGRHPLKVSVSRSCGLVSLIGEGVGERAATLNLAHVTLHDLGAQLMHAHATRCSWRLPGAHIEEAARRLHGLFISASSAS